MQAIRELATAIRRLQLEYKMTITATNAADGLTLKFPAGTYYLLPANLGGGSEIHMASAMPQDAPNIGVPTTLGLVRPTD